MSKLAELQKAYEYSAPGISSDCCFLYIVKSCTVDQNMITYGNFLLFKNTINIGLDKKTNNMFHWVYSDLIRLMYMLQFYA